MSVRTTRTAPDQRLALLAHRQYGVFTRSSARAAGVTDRMLKTRVTNGSLERVSRYVFRVAGAPSTWHQRLLIAAWSGGDDCHVSHRAAAALHGFDGFRTEIVEVVHPQLRDYRGRCGVAGITVHASSDLDPCDRTFVGPIPVTNPVRTLIDLGAVVRPERLEEALDGAIRDGHVQLDALTARHRELRRSGRNGVGPLARLLDDEEARAAAPQSVLERRFLRLLTAAGLPRPETQVRVPRADGRAAFLDVAYPAVRLGIELDGHAWHATACQRANDHERQNLVVLANWTILRFTYDDVAHRRDYVASVVRRALVACAARRSIAA